MDPYEAVETATGVRPLRCIPLAGGCVAAVWRIETADGTILVAKLGAAGSGLALEGWMLTYLSQNTELPVPDVVHADDGLLLMTHIESGGALGARAQTHAAELLARLHGHIAPRFGFERDTVIGTLVQPNGQWDSWIEFFRDRRLLYMAREALDAGRLPAALMGRIETLAGRLEEWIEEPRSASLIHGDMWAGNILVNGERVAGFVDPAIYYADAEVELAFATLFATFTDPFFRRYAELRPIRPGFREARRDIYNLYPLLVHVRLFGGDYVRSVDRTLARFGA